MEYLPQIPISGFMIYRFNSFLSRVLLEKRLEVDEPAMNRGAPLLSVWIESARGLVRGVPK